MPFLLRVFRHHSIKRQSVRSLFAAAIGALHPRMLQKVVGDNDRLLDDALFLDAGHQSRINWAMLQASGVVLPVPEP